MTDHDRPPIIPVRPRLLFEKTPHGDTGTAERLAMNRTGSFEWDLDARTLDVDEAGLLVLGLDPFSFDSRPESLVERLEPSERIRLDVAIDEAVKGGRNTYSVHFRVPLDHGGDQWTHIQARILRSSGGGRAG